VPIQIDREEAQRLLKSGANLVDVLPAPEYKRQHLAGAISIPLKQLNRDTTAILQRDVPVIVYCYDAL
jgi:rhodanese-related sulfurtransferase